MTNAKALISLKDIYITQVVKARKFEILTLNSEGLDEWRQFFEGANRTMFEAINNAITVAAKGHPEGFKLKRGEIVQTVYSSSFSLHCRHDHKAKRESFKDEPQNGGVKSNSNGNAVDLAENGCEETVCDSIRDDTDMKTVQERKYSYSEAEAFVEKIDEEKVVIMEVLRIKSVIVLKRLISPTCFSQTNSNLGSISLKTV